MVFLNLADQYLPGYALLTRRYREEFEASFAGKKLVAAVDAREKLLHDFSASTTWWHLFTGDQEARRQFLTDQFVSSKSVLFAEIENTKAYLQLLSHLVSPLIKSHEPDFCLLSAKQRDSLAKAPFSKPLYNILSLEKKIALARRDFNALDQWQKPNAIFALKEQLAIIEQHKEKIVNEWKRNFNTDPTMEELRQAIAKKKEYAMLKKRNRQRERLRKSALALSEFFPLLKALGIKGQPYIQQLEEINDDQLQTKEANLILELGKFLNHHLYQLIGVPLQYVNVHDFNKTQADSLAKLILEAFDTDKSFSPDVWIKNYKKGLLNQIITNFLLINGKTWQEQNELERLYSSSLANLFSMSKAMDKVKQFMNKFAQAHAFIQATGFATQNEFSYLAILDLYNYGLMADHIDDNKKILFGLLHPFYSLYTEYRETALYEKNNLWKTFRTLMPMLVIVVFILGISLLLAPFNLPEIFLLVIAVPVLIAAIALAAKYVSVKNAIYYSLRQRYFGGPFSIPEFQVNGRMISTFKTIENAFTIRRFYTNALKDCDTKIRFYRDKEKNALLSEIELRMMKETIARRHTLCMEWYDLHSNEELGYEEGVKIALTRLKKEASTAFKALKSELQNHLDTVHLAVNSLVDTLKLKLDCSHQWETGTSTVIKPIASPLFFQPLSKKREVESLIHLAEILDTIDTRQQNVASIG